MTPSPEFDDLFGQDTPEGNDGDVSGVAQPVSESEIDELLYSEEWTIEQRIGRLEALRSDLLQMEAADADKSDRNALFARIDDALTQLRSDRGPELDPSASDHDPGGHRETMSPDDDELLDLEAEEAAEEDEEEDEERRAAGEESDLDEVLDETNWTDDDFEPDKGVR
jgi:hypothetical protein